MNYALLKFLDVNRVIVFANTDETILIACSAGVFWVGETLFVFV